MSANSQLVTAHHRSLLNRASCYNEEPVCTLSTGGRKEWRARRTLMLENYTLASGICMLLSELCKVGYTCMLFLSVCTIYCQRKDNGLYLPECNKNADPSCWIPAWMFIVQLGSAASVNQYKADKCL